MGRCPDELTLEQIRGQEKQKGLERELQTLSELLCNCCAWILRFLWLACQG